VQAGGGSIVVTPLVGLACATTVTVIVLAAGARPWRGRTARTSAWCAPLALGLAFASAFLATRSLPAFPPRETLQWLFWFALGASLHGILGPSGRAAGWTRAFLSMLLPFLVLAFQRRHHWERLEGALWTAGLAAWLFSCWQLALRGAERASAAPAALGLALTCALAAATFGLAGGGLFFVLPATLALATGALALLGFWRGEPGLGARGWSPFVVLFFGCLWCARYLYELSAVGFALLSLVPLAPESALLVPGQHAKWRALIALFAPFLLAAATLAYELAHVSTPLAYG
jgi:hypothetical protein